jgi:integrase
MTQVNLTTKGVASLKFKPGHGNQTLYQAKKTPGLGVRVTEAGVRSYIFESTLHGRTVRQTIGDIRTWTLAAAKAEATRLKTLTDRGIHPRKERDEQQAVAEADRVLQAVESVLVGTVWTEYLEHYGPKWGARHLRDHQNLSQPGGVAKKRGKGHTKPGVLDQVMRYHLVDITAVRLKKWLKEESVSRANNARQGFALFRTFWRWAAAHPIYKAVVNLAVVEDKDLLEEIPERKTHKSDVLQTTQLKAWFFAVRAIPNPVISAYLQMLLLTGARRGELAELRWKDVDFSWRTVWVKDKVSKAGRDIPLTPYVSALLSTLPRASEWVFSSPTSDSGHISEPRIAHDKALSNAKLNHVTIQATRRTFISLAKWLPFPVGVIGQIVGHAPNSTPGRHYEFLPIDLLRTWHDRYEAWILSQAGVRSGGRRSRGKRSLGTIPARLHSIEPRRTPRASHRDAATKTHPPQARRANDYLTLAEEGTISALAAAI